MPTAFRRDGYRFFFYSNEGDPREPVHVHVMLGGSEAKFWLAPEVILAASAGFDARTLRRLAGIVAARRDEIERAWAMSIPAESVRFDDDAMWVTLADGRVLGVPLAWFPRLLHASPAEGEAVTVSPFGLHWEALDEDISVAGLLAGRGGMSRLGEVA